jgi:hypothetical protein
MCGEGMENLVTTGKIQGKRDRGRQRKKILDGVCKWWSVKDNKGIFTDERDRTRSRNMIGNAFRQGPDDNDYCFFNMNVQMFR